MRDLAAMLKLLRQLKEAISFLRCAPRCIQLVLRGAGNEVGLNHSDDQTTRGNLRPGPREGGRGSASAIRSDSGGVYGFVNAGLADIFVYGVVGDKANLTQLIRLSVEILIVVGDLRQKGIARLSAIFMRRSGLGASRVVDGAVRAREFNRFGERNLHSLGSGRSLLRSWCEFSRL